MDHQRDRLAVAGEQLLDRGAVADIGVDMAIAPAERRLEPRAHPFRQTGRRQEAQLVVQGGANHVIAFPRAAQPGIVLQRVEHPPLVQLVQLVIN